MKHWIIESSIEPEQAKRLAQSVIAAGGSVEEVDFLPYSGKEQSFAIGKTPRLQKGHIFHGALDSCNWVAKHTAWTVYPNTEKFDCSYYYPRVACLNDECDFVPFGKLIPWKDRLFDRYEQDGCIFIRPNGGDKRFTGSVVEYDTYESDIKKLGFYEVMPEEMCVVTYPASIMQEMRFIVSPKGVITGSVYQMAGKKYLRETDAEEEDLAHFMLQHNYCPADIWVMDLAMCASGKTYVLEMGAFSASGLYACNTDKIVKFFNNE